MMSPFHFRAYVASIFTLVVFATSVHADAVDDYVRSQLLERHVPGVAVAVIKAGRIVKLKGFGRASVEFNVAVTPQTVFEIGSVSKQMTAAGIMLLLEDGKIDLDEKISASIRPKRRTRGRTSLSATCLHILPA